MAKKDKRIKKAGNFVFWFLRRTLGPIVRKKYKIKFDRDSAKNVQSPCLILSNHQAGFDQFAVAMGFRFGINFVASDSLFRHGFASKLMRSLARPIPFAKGSKDPTAVKNIFSVIKQGGSVAMFPSGSRSFFGAECLIRPGIGKLAKRLGVPLVLVVMKGGFNCKARFMHTPSKGKVSVGVSKVVSPEELTELTPEQIDEIIIRELSFNETEWNRIAKVEFKGKRKAEFVEHSLFYCPQCGRMETLVSEGNEFYCTDCNMRVRINSIGLLERAANADNCPDSILDWSKLQLQHMKNIDYSLYINTPLLKDENTLFSRTMRSQKDIPLGTGEIALYGDRLKICGIEILAKDIVDLAVQSYNRLMIYTADNEYVADLPARGNAVKYMIGGYRIKQLALGTDDGFFGY